MTSKEVEDEDVGVLSQSRYCCSCCCSPLVRKILWFIIATILLAIGLFAALGDTLVATFAMQSALVLTNWRTRFFITWQDEANMEVDVFRHYYFYNVTNPLEVYFDRVKPDLNLVGPFVFQTRRSRPLPYVYWDADDNVNFRYHDWQFFRPDLSVDAGSGSRLDADTELITTMNMAYFIASWRVSKIPEFKVPLLNGSYIVKQDICLLLDLERIFSNSKERALGPKGIFTQRTATEWLFGFEDDTLKMLHAGSAVIDYYVPTRFHLQFNDSVPAPGPIDFRHGQVCPLADDESQCNTSTVADSAISSGRSWNSVDGGSSFDLNGVGVVKRWVDNERLWWFGGGGKVGKDEPGYDPDDRSDDDHPEDDSDCQEMGGTEGLWVGAFTDKRSRPRLFVDGIFRHIELAFVAETNVAGIDALRFGPAPSEYSLNARNRRCYRQYYEGAILNLSNTAFSPGTVTAKFFFPMKGDEPLLHPAFGDRRNLHILPNGTKVPLRYLNFTMRWPPGSNNKVEMRDIMSGPNYTTTELGSHLDIHPLTGCTLAAHSRMQINAMLGPILIDGCKYSNADLLNQTRLDPNGNEYESFFPETALPILLVDRVAEAPPKVVSYLKSAVIEPLRALRIAGYVLVALSGILIVTLLVYYCYYRPGAIQRRKLTNNTLAPHTSFLEDDALTRHRAVGSPASNASIAHSNASMSRRDEARIV